MEAAIEAGDATQARIRSFRWLACRAAKPLSLSLLPSLLPSRNNFFLAVQSMLTLGAAAVCKVQAGLEQVWIILRDIFRILQPRPPLALRYLPQVELAPLDSQAALTRACRHVDVRVMFFEYLQDYTHEWDTRPEAPDRRAGHELVSFVGLNEVICQGTFCV